MSIQVPKGVVRLPLTINEAHPAVTLAGSVANVESEIATIRIPRKAAFSIREGDQLYLLLKVAAGTTIVAGSVKVYLADANKQSKWTVVDGTPVTAFATLDDETKKFRFKAGFARGEDEYLIIAFKGADVVDSTKTAILLTGVQFLET